MLEPAIGKLIQGKRYVWKFGTQAAASENVVYNLIKDSLIIKASREIPFGLSSMVKPSLSLIYLEEKAFFDSWRNCHGLSHFFP